MRTVLPWLCTVCLLAAAHTALAQAPNAPVLNCLRADTLFWEEPADACGALGRIEVFGARELAGPYDNLGSIGAGLGPFFPLTPAQAGAGYDFFYVQAVYPTCSPNRSAPSNTLDGTPLAVPRILSVDYTPTGTRLDWEHPDDSRVTKYYIYRETDQGTTLIDSVLGGVTEYFEAGTQVERASAIYYIGSLDDCNSSSFNSTQFASATVSAERDACAGLVRITLEQAAPWPFAFSEARFERRRLGGPTDFVAVASPGTSVTIEDVAPDSAYTLQAIYSDADGGLVAALPIDLPAVDFVAEDTIEIAQVTYEDEGWRLRWRWEPRAAYAGTRYAVRRGGSEIAAAATDPDLDREPMPSVDLPIPADFDWTGAQVTVTSTDGCGVTRASAPARPGIVSAEEVGPTGMLVSWSLPEAPPSANVSWDLRFADGTVGSRLLISTDAETQYLHDVTDVAFREVCYQTVTEVELPAVLRRGAETTTWRSAPSCALRSPRVYLPTGFVPEGYTQSYRPRVSLIEGLTYQMDIYDRWGKRLFRTDDPFEGWPGSGRNGQAVPPGLYMAVVTLEEGGREVMRVPAQVTVVR